MGNLPVCKTARRFTLEALYGIQQSQSLMLSRIPDFRYYAIADGISAILAGRQPQAFDFAREPAEESAQADMLELYGSWVT